MSHPFYNRTTRDLLSVLEHNDALIADQIYEVALISNYQQDNGANPNPAVLGQITYPQTISSGIASVDAQGIITIEKGGLYCISATAVFDDSLKDGSRRQVLTVTQNAVRYDLGSDTKAINIASPITTMSTTLNNTSVLALAVGDTIEHEISYIGAAFPVIVVGASASPVNYTKVLLTLID